MRKQFGMLVATACLAATVAVALPVQAAMAAPAHPAAPPDTEVVSSDAVGTLPDVVSVVPSRLLDTRDGSARVGSGETVSLGVLGVGGVPASGVGSVLLNVTATNVSQGSWVTVWPAGVDRPLASNLNPVAGQKSANLVLVGVGAGGKVSLYNDKGPLDLVIDVVGWVAAPDVNATVTQWRVRPESVLLPRHKTQRVQIVGLDAAGEVVPGAVPPAVSFAASSTAVTASYLGGGKVQLTSGGEFGSTIFAATVPGQGPVGFTASVAQVAAGVQELPDKDVVFPVPYLSPGDDPTSGIGDLVGDGTLAGFTLAEIEARLSAVSAVSPGTDGVPTPDAHFPLILRGDGPATGSLIVTAGGSGVTGRVIEPAGLPTLHRGGFTLVTVQMVAMTVLYESISYSVSTQQLIDLGLIVPPPASSADPTKAGAVPSVGPKVVERRQSSAGKPAIEGVQPAAVPAYGGFGQPATSTTCSVNHASIEAKAGIFPSITPVLDFVADTVEDHYRFVVGVQGSFTLQATVDVQLAPQIECTFPSLDLGSVRVPVPAGPATGLISFEMRASIVPKLTFKIKGGPKLTLGIQCKSSLTIQAGFESRAGVLTDLNKAEKSPTECPVAGVSKAQFPKLSALGIIDGQAAFAAEVSASLNLTLIMGVQVGGVIADELGSLFGHPHAGNVDLLSIEIGPEVKAAIENRANTVIEEASGTKLGVQLKGAAKLTLPELEYIGALLHLSGPFSVTLGEIAIDLMTPVGAPATSGMTASVAGGSFDDLANDATIYVEPNDTVVVRSKLSYPQGGGGEPLVEASTAYQSDGAPVVSDRWTKQPSPTMGTVEFKTTVTTQQCLATQLSGGFRPETFSMLAMWKLSIAGIQTDIEMPAWAGKFKLQCTQGKIRVEPKTIEGNGTVDLFTTGKTEDQWRIQGTLPSWLDVSLTSDSTKHSGPLAFSPVDEQQVPLTVKVDSPNTCDEPQSQDVVFVTDHRGSTTLKVSQKDRCYVKMSPEKLDNGGTTTLTTEGPVADILTLTTELPNWLTVLPIEELLNPTHGTPFTRTYGFLVTPPDLGCSEVWLTETVPVSFHSNSRGDVTVMVSHPTIKTAPCPPPIDTVIWGDPHVVSFDGATYDAQVLGEYRWMEPVTAGAEVPTVHVRAELTNPAGGGAFQPTSITAAGVRLGGHTFEVYTRPAAVLLDGQPFTLSTLGVRELAPGVSISRSPDVWLLEDNGVTIRILQSGTILDVRVAAAQGTAVHGFAGSPDGNPDNDVTTSAGVQYTLAQAREHSTELYAFTDSWRITNRASSLLSREYDGFHDANPPHSVAALAPFRAQVLTRLGDIAKICGGEDSYLVDQLALELAIGRSLDDVLTASCTYTVYGVARADGFPVGGLQVTIDAPGLAPCIVTTNADGTYVCAAGPDLSELALMPVPTTTAGPDVRVDGRWNGDPRVVVTAVAVFSSPAAIGSGRWAQADLDVPTSELPAITVHGVATSNGSPITAAIPLNVIALNASGGELTRFTRTINPAGGAYTLTFLAPKGSATLRLSTPLGVDNLDDLQLTVPAVDGANDVPWDLIDNYPAVHVHGLVTRNGTPVTTVLNHFFDEYAGAATNGTQAGQFTPAADGTFGVDLRLRRSSTAFGWSVAAGLGTQFAKHLPVAQVHVGSNDVLLDVPFIERTLHIDGVIDRGGVIPATATVTATYQFDGFPNPRFLPVAPDPTTGAYSTSLLLPEAVATVDLVLTVPGALNTVTATATMTDIDTHFTLSMSDQPTRLTVSGTVSRLGVELDGIPPFPPGGGFVQFYILYMTGYDSSGTVVEGRYVPLSTRHGGTYATTSEWGPTVASVGMNMLLGDHGEYVQIVGRWPVNAGQNNAVTFSPNLAKLVVDIGVSIQGVPVPANVSDTFTVVVRADDGSELLRLDRAYDTDSAGNAKATMFVPVGASSVDFTFANDPSHVYTLPGLNTTGDQELPLAIDYSAKRFQASMAVNALSGAISGTLYVTVRSYGPDPAHGGKLIELSSVELSETADVGSVQVDRLVPVAATAVSVEFDVDGEHVVHDFELTGSTTNVGFTWTPYQPVVEYTGHIAAACSGVSQPVTLALELVTDGSPGADTPVRIVSPAQYVIPDPTTGNYRVLFDMPDNADLGAPGATFRLVATSLDGDVAEGTGRAAVNLQGSPPRQSVDAPVTPICTSVTRSFTVNGTMLNGGSPWAIGDMDVVITPYALDGSNANVSPPWTDLGAITVNLHVDDSLGTWTWTGDLPANAAVVNVELKPFGNTFGYQQAYVLPSGAGPVVETFDRDFGPAQVTFFDRVLTDASCTAPTLMITYQVYAFAAEPADKSGDPSTWAGAHVLDPVTAVPALGDPLTLTTVQMPADTTYFFVTISPSSVYTPGLWNTAMAWGTTIPLGGNVGFGNNYTFGCF